MSRHMGVGRLDVIAVCAALVFGAGCSKSVDRVTGEGAGGMPGAGADGGGGGGGSADGAAGNGPGALDTTCPALTMPSAAATAYVDAKAAAGGDGTRAAPFSSLALAFQSAGSDAVIWVTSGTYAETLTVPDSNLAVLGGFAPGFGSRSDACATVLQPAAASAGATDAVLTVPPEVRRFAIDGLTVQKGARGLAAGGEASGSVLTITSCVFAENGRPDAVGGAAAFDRVSANVSGSVFRDNNAEKGAAIALAGDDATITIERSVFERNVGHSDHGGALYLSPRSASITGNTFRGNAIGKDVGYGWGGAVIVYRAGAAPVKADFAFNVFTDNLASVGGAVFIDDGASATMSHDLLYRNRSIAENGVARGAAIYVDGLDGPGTGSRLVADHITVVDNALDQDGAVMTARGGGVYLETYSTAVFTNSIFWNNGDEALFGDPTCSIAVTYSIAPSTCAGVATCTIGAGVLQPSDVGFVNAAANDYHELPTSPAVDGADPSASVDNEPAPNGGRANLGVYGGTRDASTSPGK